MYIEGDLNFLYDEEPNRKEALWRNYSPALWSWGSFENMGIFKIIPY